MGELIRFRPRQGAKPGARLADDVIRDPANGATILFFTGIRYERHADEPALTPPARAPKGQSPRNGRRKRA